MKSFRVRMTALAVLIALVSVGMLMLISYQRVSQSMSEQMETNYSVAADKYAQELTAWINANASIIDAMAAEITAGGVYTQDYGAFHAFLADNCRLLNRNNTIYDIYFTYPDNRMVCASDFLSDGSVDYAHERDWFTEAAATGELFYSSPYRDSDSGKPIITISKAIYRDNHFQGVLAADIFVDVLVDIIREADVAADSYAFLVDRNLGMIAHPNEAYAFDDVPLGVMDVPGAPYADVVSRIRSNSNGMVYLDDYDGVPRGVVVSRMANTGWYVGVATSRSVLRLGMEPMIRGFMIATAVAAVVVGSIAVLLAYVMEKLNRQRRQYETQVKRLEDRIASGKPVEGLIPKRSEGDPAQGGGKGNARRINLLVPVLTILGLMICMVFYTSRIIRNVAVTNIREVGEDRLSAATAQLENYLEMSKSTLWVTADTVDHMVRNGASTQSVLEYITEETQTQKEHFDSNITGIYGVVSGEYLDGLAWVPPENYDPTQRDWYVEALRAGGNAVIVSPYVDMQTGSVIISICRMLSNGRDVLSVDLMMDHIQEIVSGLQIKDKGYGFIVNRDGMLIAHQDASKKGGTLTEDEEQLALLDTILEKQNGVSEIQTEEGGQTVFFHEIMDQWYVAIVINSGELFAEVRQQLAVNILICAVIFALITFFYLLGRRNEQNYSRRIEQMRAEEQRQTYEARALKLEKEASDQANKAKSDFLAEMSHEIRTPINAVLGMNEMILRESDRSRFAPGRGGAEDAMASINACARNIESAGSNLLAIVNDILDLSKIEAGKMSITEGDYRLSAILNDLSNMIFFKAHEKGLEFVVDVDEALPDGLHGDKVRVRQILTNLLNNAVKYTQSGSVTLRLRGEAQAPCAPGQVIRLIATVRDTGVGIRREDMDKLYDKFQRLDLEQNGTVEGTGLGLAITRSLLDMMGGSIDVQSEYGKGSAFTVVIPQRIASAEPIGDFHTRFRTSVQEAKPYREKFRAPDARLLIVDDTKMNLTVVVGLLRNTRLRIDTATGGEEALLLAQSNAYDLILMDQRMPGMDGTEALHRIRAQSGGANRETPVICLTADAVIGARERYMAEGFTDYLTKPIDGMALEDMIMRYLPGEKVVSVADAPDAGEARQNEDYAPLVAAGIDPGIGLGYCQGDDALYRTLLQDYLQNAGERTQGLERRYDERDWKAYAILAHTVKSASKTIGASALSDIAAGLESAADAGDLPVLQMEHRRFLEKYSATASATGSVIPLAGEQTADGEILEFPPE